MTFLQQEDIQYLPVPRSLVNSGESSPLFNKPFIYSILAQLPCSSEFQSLQNRMLTECKYSIQVECPRTIYIKIRIQPSKWVSQRMNSNVHSTRIHDWGAFFSLLGLEKNTTNLCLHTHTFSYGSKNKAKLTSLSSFTTNKIKYLLVNQFRFGFQPLEMKKEKVTSLMV